MPQFVDVALPVPLDSTFTYRLDGTSEVPQVGARVIVPWREQKLSGIVTALHDDEPRVKTKYVLRVLDEQPALSATLMELGRWIAHYYIAPIGEVYRTMLPLSAEFRRARGLQITQAGETALYEAATGGSSLRARKNDEHQDAEYEVLNYLLERGVAREQTVRTATGASREVIQGLLRKRWIKAQDLSDVRDATRTVKVAVLRGVDGKLNANQKQIVQALAEADGKRLAVEVLRELPVPHSSLQTLVKRKIVEIVNEAADFAVSSMTPRKSQLAYIFNPRQKSALEHVTKAVAKEFSVTLLHGVTGSGKTAVYLAAMQQVLDSGRGCIMLVPEIGLTPAAAAHLYQVFGEQVAVLHSGLSNDERAEQWHRIRRGEKRVVVGTRSAVFAPIDDLALIVVDEEHDGSYKQEESPRYHARDVAVMRAKLIGAAVVLGSATPSLESYFNAQKKKYALIEMPDRVERRPLPEVELVDMKREHQETGHFEAISRKLADELEQRLSRGEQAMVLLNRRGYSAFVMCRTCGETVQCKNCAVSMTYHKNSHRLECHYCGHMAKPPALCPKCGSEYVQYLGTGSEKLEALLHSMFPQARIGRLDRDTVRGREDFERVLNALNAGDLDVLVGTQMIAKGHDVHGVTLVGVVGADAALAFPDFRAAERTFQLLTQVAGRAGRGEIPGKVILQTHNPEHYAVQFAAHHDFNGFYDKELRYRSWMHYPPFNALANVLVRSDKLEDALKWSAIFGQWFKDTRHEGVRVLGPAAAPIVRLKNDFRYHLVLKSASRENLNSTLRAVLAHAVERKVPRGNIVVDVDAQSLS
jgi:primosomal protein N' (replication factor Y)